MIESRCEMIVSIGIFIALAIAVILYQKKKASGMVYEKEQQKYFSDAARCEFTCRVSVLCGSTGGIMGEHARLERNNCGEGVRTEKLIAKTGGREIPITIELPERQYNGKELEKAFETAMKKLDGIIWTKIRHLMRCGKICISHPGFWICRLPFPGK